MALVSFSGLASGIDSKSLIQAILDQQRAAKVKPLEARIATYQDTNSAFSKLKELLGGLNSAAAKFRLLNGGAIAKSGTSSDETILSATVSNSAASGTYALNISQLAKNATYSFKSTGTYTSSTDAINSSINNGDPAADRTVTVTIGTGANTETTNIELTNASTLSDFVTQFNESSTKGTASIVNAGSTGSPDYRILINTANSGVDKGQVIVSVGTSITGSGAGALNSNSVSQATDTSFTISGITGSISRATNSVSDVIPGVTFSLQSTGSATVSVQNDPSTTVSTVQAFVDAYNEVITYVHENDLITRDDSKSNDPQNIFGPLADTSVDENLVSTLRSALSGAATSGYTVNTLSDLGITTQRDGTLALNSDTLKEAIGTDPTGASIVTQALGETLSSVSGTIAQFNQFGGIIDAAINANQESITSFQSRITDEEKRLSLEEATLVARFASLEKLVGQLQSQQSQLTSVLGK